MIDRSLNQPGAFGRASMLEIAVIIVMQEVTADFKPFLELSVCPTLDVVVAVVALVALGLTFHGILEGCCDTYIVYNQAAGLLREHSVHSGYCLHQVMVFHWLIDIHSRQ